MSSLILPFCIVRSGKLIVHPSLCSLPADRMLDCGGGNVMDIPEENGLAGSEANLEISLFA